MGPMLWNVVAIAAPNQSDSGKLRVCQVYAYGLNQAWAYGQRHFGPFADVVTVSAAK